MALTDTKLKSLKSKEKVYRVSDGRGLYIELNPNGSKYWRHKYRYLGKEKRMSYGVYPEVSLKEARERTEQTRSLLRDGIDPGTHKKQEKLQKTTSLSNNFATVAQEWLRSC